MAPRIFIFSIAIGADYSYEVKNSKIWAPAFFKHNNLFIATVCSFGSGLKKFALNLVVFFFKNAKTYNYKIKCKLSKC